MTENRKVAAAIAALYALGGWFAPVPVDMDVSEILAEMPEMGGLKLADTPKVIASKAQQPEDSKVTYIAVNKLIDGDVHITMLLDTPEKRQRTVEEVLSDDGYAFAYVYNNSCDWCSELGDVIVKQASNGRIRRIG